MRIFFDVDTQNDFMNPKGELYVPEAETLKPVLKLLAKYAARNVIPQFGSVDRHFGTPEYKAREGELAKWGGPFPDHCMSGSYGQKKILETNPVCNFNRKNCFIENSVTPLDEKDAPLDWTHCRGVYFEKQNYDVFTNPMADRFLRGNRIQEAVVYGVATDFCVKAAVLGMQQRGIQTYVVEDAIKGVFPESTKTALEEMAAAGAKFVMAKQVLEGRI
ncbi:MAG: isochorismatase family protein [archaeon]